LHEAATDRPIRDLMGLLALPALWVGRDGATILQIMTEAVERVVPIRFSYVHATLIPGRPPIEPVRVDGRVVTGNELEAWRHAAAGWANRREADACVHLSDTPLGQMRMVRFSMGYGSHGAHIWFGSSDETFPTTMQIAFLRAATSLATTGLQTARASHEREEASRAKDEFLAMLGHELRNPLAPIVTALQLIELKNGGSLTNEHAIIARQVGHLRRLVDDLMDVSRITRGKVELKKELCDIKAILAQAIEDVGPLMEERRHALAVDLGDENIRVFGDAMRLAQVFTNLLTNAAKYTDPGGAIAIAARVQQDTVSITVSDNGSGIDPQLLSRLFNIFEQGVSTIDRSKGGLGIGLALVKNFVELHGGTVTAASEGTGCGSRFIVSLPLSKDIAGVQPASAPALPSSPRFVRVLVVDDNLDALETMRNCLRERDYEVAIASDPLQALRLAQQFRPTVALLDIGLPVMDGYQLAKALRMQFPGQELRLLALTGYGQATDKTRSKSAGFDGHLVKPVDLDDLIAALAG
jgi:signal transduction histidine kinase